jgi:hypothetical protein
VITDTALLTSLLGVSCNHLQRNRVFISSEQLWEKNGEEGKVRSKAQLTFSLFNRPFLEKFKQFV